MLTPPTPRHARVLAIVLPLLFATVAPACDGRTSEVEDMLAALDRDRDGYLGLDRLEFVAVFEQRLERLHHLSALLADAGAIDRATALANEEAHGELASDLLDLKLRVGDDWEAHRTALVEGVAALEEGLRAATR